MSDVWKFVLAFWSVAVFLICCGFAHAHHRRMRQECAANGHQWTDYDGTIDGIECAHCFMRPRRK